MQLAKWKGAHVIGAASGKNQALLRELGVDEPIDYEKARSEDVVHDVDVVLDTLGGETQNGKLKPVVETVLPVSDARRAHELNEAGHARGKTVLKVA